MIDDLKFQDEEQTNHEDSLLEEQAIIVSQMNASGDVVRMCFNPKSTILNVPKTKQSKAFSIDITNTDCRYKRLIFGVMNAAYYQYFMTDEFEETRKERFRSVRFLWDYLSNKQVNDRNKAILLKEYERWRVEVHGVKTQSTGLTHLKLHIEAGLGLDAFNSTIDQWEKDYLKSLANTPQAIEDETAPQNLNIWFTQHTWLRRTDVGIGHELYTRLGSPKALIGSFRVTAEITLLQLQAAKDALVTFFREADVASSCIPEIPQIKKNEDRYQFEIANRRNKASIFNFLIEKLSRFKGRSFDLTFAIEALVSSEATAKYRIDTVNKFLLGHKLQYNYGKDFRFRAKVHTGLFDTNFLRQLAIYAEKPSGPNRQMPICDAEQVLFSWLMAYQTVQASDIPKLTLSNFKFIRRTNGKVTHIESDYFKGRASSVHHVKTLSMKDDIGKAVFRYLQDVSGFNKHGGGIVKIFKCKPGSTSLIGRLLLTCRQTSLAQKLEIQYQKNNVTPVFLSASVALIKNGVSKASPLAKRGECKTQTQPVFFGLSQIKTSAVYAESDFFSPTTLLNNRSHNNETERQSYLTQHNEEWLNNCGRITRAVMTDLAVNVLRSSKSDKQLFNSEYTEAMELIKMRSEETLIRMQMITKKNDGRIDALGFNTRYSSIEASLPDTLYLEDSPQTVMKLRHYLQQLEEKHSLLLSCSPEFLFNTALPNAEWIEILLAADDKFCVESLAHGDALYQKYRSILPPLFDTQIA